MVVVMRNVTDESNLCLHLTLSDKKKVQKHHFYLKVFSL